jgi:hypothetical protein
VPAIRDQPPEAWARARQAALRMARPLERFLRVQAAGGIVLLAMALIAMLWANSPWQSVYHALWHTPVIVGVGPLVLDRDLHFNNEVLMVLFFSWLASKSVVSCTRATQRAQTCRVAAAALGGMIAPALIYLAPTRSPIRARVGACRWRLTSRSRSACSLPGRRVLPRCACCCCLADHRRHRSDRRNRDLLSGWRRIPGLLLRSAAALTIAFQRWR